MITDIDRSVLETIKAQSKDTKRKVSTLFIANRVERWVCKILKEVSPHNHVGAFVISDVIQEAIDDYNEWVATYPPIVKK